MAIDAAKVVGRLRAIAADQATKNAAAVYRLGESYMTEAKRRTPYEFGVLRASGTVLPPETTGTTTTATLMFGGAAAGYAVPVHERLISNAPGPRQGLPIRHAPPTGAKFLESVIDEHASTFEAEIAAALGKIAG